LLYQIQLIRRDADNAISAAPERVHADGIYPAAAGGMGMTHRGKFSTTGFPLYVASSYFLVRQFHG
jgi:hypothetical protein